MDAYKAVFASDAPVPRLDGLTGTTIGALVEGVAVAVVFGTGLGCSTVLSALMMSAAYEAKSIVVKLITGKARTFSATA